jgi:hypothetical protein
MTSANFTFDLTSPFLGNPFLQMNSTISGSTGEVCDIGTDYLNLIG